MISSWLSRIFAFSLAALLLIPIFVVGCGDEGNNNGGMDITTPPDSPPDTNSSDGVDQPNDQQKVSFQQDVFPIFQANCIFAGCHGTNPPSGLLLTSYDNFKKGGVSGQPFVPGDNPNSLIIRRIDGGGMPLDRTPLKADQIQLIKDWIDEGANNN